MRTRWIAIALAAGLAVFVATLLFGVQRVAERSDGEVSAQVAELSEELSDGRISAQIRLLGDRNIELEVRFTPNSGAIVANELRPTVSLAMSDMHMDGVEPPLELLGPGRWRSRVRLPMNGKWIASVGIGEEFAEVEFISE